MNVTCDFREKNIKDGNKGVKWKAFEGLLLLRAPGSPRLYFGLKFIFLFSLRHLNTVRTGPGGRLERASPKWHKLSHGRQ